MEEDERKRVKKYNEEDRKRKKDDENVKVFVI